MAVSAIVPLAGSIDNCMITTIFGITLTGEFLRIQMVHLRKTSKSLPHVEFPESLS